MRALPLLVLAVLAVPVLVLGCRWMRSRGPGTGAPGATDDETETCSAGCSLTA